MTEPLRAQHIRKSELELLDSKVSRDGGSLRFLAGAEHGIATSIMEAEVPPGSGPRRHRHPYAELFVLHVGQGRFEVEGAYLDAEAGDVVIVPAGAWHAFVNTGSGPLHQTAIHESPREDTTFEDGSRRG